MSTSVSAFSSEEYRNAYPDGIENHYWNQARNRIILKTLLQANCSQSIILDIGCGRGITVDFLRNEGLKVFGSEVAQAPVPDRLKKFIYTSQSAFELDLKFRNQVTTLLILDVLEHLTDPQKFLENAITSFPRVETIVLTVPARPELWSNYDDYYGHHLRYTHEGFTTLITKSDLAIKDMRYFFKSLYFPMWLANRISKQRKVKLSGPTHPWLHKLLGKWIYLETLILPKKVYGTSLIAVVKKKN